MARQRRPNLPTHQQAPGRRCHRQPNAQAHTMQQAHDFLDTCNALHQLLGGVQAQGWGQPTQFKQWTIDDIIGHLHLWNLGADLALRAPQAFDAQVQAYRQALANGESRQAFTRRWLGGVQGPALHGVWHQFYPQLAAHFAAADPKQRVAWLGPSMSARSSISARLMETWAHAQAIYDLLGVEREATDAIRHIAQLGVNTRGWTFSNRGLPVPAPAPQVRLQAPSGALWLWDGTTQVDPVADAVASEAAAAAESVTGTALAFCQVVTQVRHVDDTSLVVQGAGAQAWMQWAQCFAGAPNDPPAPGTRYRQ